MHMWKVTRIAHPCIVAHYLLSQRDFEVKKRRWDLAFYWRVRIEESRNNWLFTFCIFEENQRRQMTWF